MTFQVAEAQLKRLNAHINLFSFCYATASYGIFCYKAVAIITNPAAFVLTKLFGDVLDHGLAILSAGYDSQMEYNPSDRQAIIGYALKAINLTYRLKTSSIEDVLTSFDGLLSTLLAAARFYENGETGTLYIKYALAEVIVDALQARNQNRG